MIVVAVCDASTSGSGSMTDNAATPNVYTSQVNANLNNSATNGFARIFTAPVKTALTAANTITYTKGATGTVACISAFYALGTTGQIDTTVNATATGSSTSPSVTSGVAHTNTLLFAMVGYGNSGTYTQDTTHNWATPFTAVTGSTTRGIGGGNQQQNSNTAIVFNPTLGTTGVWAALVTGLQAALGGSGQQDSDEANVVPRSLHFRRRSIAIKGRSEFSYPRVWQNAGWEVQPPQPPSRETRARLSAATMRGDDGTENTFWRWINWGEQVQPWQPPVQYKTKWGSFLAGDPGNEAPLNPWINDGWEQTFAQPPAFRRGTRGAGWRGDDGTVRPLINWFNWGWEPNLPLPLTPYPYKVRSQTGVALIGDVGNEAPLNPWLNWGWEAQPPQPPHLYWRGHGLRGEDGTEAIFVAVVAPPAPPWGFDIQPLHPRIHVYKRYPGTRGRSEFSYPNIWVNAGWEQTQTQPLHRFFKSPDVGDIGIEFQFIPTVAVVTTWGFEQFTQPQHRFFRSPEFGDQGIQFPFVNWLNFGWEVQPPLPPHTLRRGHGLIGEAGNEGLFTLWLNAGWEIQSWQPPHRLWRGHGLIGHDGIAAPFINWFNFGWEQAHANVRHPIWKSPSIGDPLGIDFGFINFYPFGFEQTATQPLHRFFKSPDTGDTGNEAVFSFIPPGFVFWPFDPAFSQDPRRHWERFAGIARGPDGIDAPFNPWLNWGFEETAIQPPHRIWKTPDIGDQGIQSPFIQWLNFGWEPNVTQPPHCLWRGHGLRGEDGNEAPFVQWLNWFEQTYSQPLHKIWHSPDTGDSGNEATFTFIPPGFVFWPFDPTISQDPRRRWEKTAALMRGPDGIEGPQINWFNWGWDIQPPPPPHPVRRGQGLAGIDAIEFSYLQWRNWGWEVQPYQPPHPIWKSPTAGDPSGIDFGLIAFYPFGFEQVFTQPVHRFWKSPDIGDAGIESPFVPPPLVPLVNLGWEGVWSQDRHKFWKSPEFGDQGIQLPLINWFNWGWEVQPPPPPAFLRGRRGSGLRGDDGIVRPFVYWLNDGWNQILSQDKHPRPERAGAILRGDEGNQGPFTFWRNFGWEPVLYQPPHRPLIRQAASIMFGEPGIEYPFVQWLNWGWEQTFAQPRFWPTLGQRGAFLFGEPASEWPITVPPFIPSVPWFSPTLQGEALTKRTWNNRAGGLLPWGDDGIELPFIPILPPPFRPVTGKLLIIDAPGWWGPYWQFGKNPLVNENCQLLIVSGPGLPIGGGPVLFTFTRPDGTFLVGDPRFAFIGDTTVRQIMIPNFPVGQYVVYTFAVGDLNMAGTWKVSFIAPNFISATYTFNVVYPSGLISA
jgi:hypothetical protein